MTQRTWNLQIEPGATNPTWDRRAIPMALARISRYFAASFPQVARNPWMRVAMVSWTPNKDWAAWTTGRTIYIWKGYRYRSLQELVAVLVHEFGHVFGGSSHGGDNDVMGPYVRDVYRNFTVNDYRWFRSLGIRPATQVPRAYDEPNYWRPKARDSMQMWDQMWLQDNPLTCGHGSWLDRIRGMMTKTTILEVE